MTETAYLVEPGFTRSAVLRNPLVDSPPRALFYPDGTIRIEHKCKTIDDPVEVDVLIICAPKLSPGHRIVSLEPLTVEGSIACPDCGLHGWAREGSWVAA